MSDRSRLAEAWEAWQGGPFESPTEGRHAAFLLGASTALAWVREALIEPVSDAARLTLVATRTKLLLDECKGKRDG